MQSLRLALRRSFHRISINIPQEQCFQSVYCFLSIRAHSGQVHGCAGDNAQRHDTKKTFRVHLAVTGFQPDTALEFVRLLYKVCSLTIMQAGFTAHNDFFIEHIQHSFLTHLHGNHASCIYDSQFHRKSQSILALLHKELSHLPILLAGNVYNC